MPLFGFRKDKKHEQSHIQATAELAKTVKKGDAKDKGAKQFSSPKPEKISSAVVTKDAGAGKAGPALPKGSFGSATESIIRPHITEKSGILSQSGAYTFQVTSNANKSSVAKAMRALYKVTPVKVAMVNLPSKNVFVKGRRGTVSGVRKAIVTVKKGEKIDFV
ncbi:MAG: 50S ribosomal protein L23 [Minisyncoccia bacterium]|jgi:large subunit ribosomal protein L23